LLRGSGLKGLVSFNQITTNYNRKLKILRPLINIKKDDLEYITKRVFKFKFEDPSNNNTNYKRIRIRNLVNYLKSEGLDLEKLKLTINNLSDSNLTINYYVNENIKYNSKYFKHKRHYIISNNFFNQPHEIVFRSIVNLFKKVGNKYYPPRGKSVQQLLSKFVTGEIKKINISGCILEKINNSFIIYEEK
jgi:tRNA(Ile)-lysidine synthase